MSAWPGAHPPKPSPPCPQCLHPLTRHVLIAGDSQGARQCCAPGLSGEGCRCVLLPEATVDAMTDTDEASEITAPVKVVSRDGVAITYYRPLPEVLAIISTIGIIALLLILLAAVIL